MLPDPDEVSGLNTTSTKLNTERCLEREQARRGAHGQGPARHLQAQMSRIPFTPDDLKLTDNTIVVYTTDNRSEPRRD